MTTDGTGAGDRLLAGRRVLVTGAASGIGRATVLAAVAAAARVAAVDRDADGLASLASALPDRPAPAGGRLDPPGGLVAVRQADVTAEPEVTAAVEAAVAELGGLDAVLHVAGIMRGQQVPVTQLPLAVWQQVVTVNLTGAFLVAKHTAPHLAAAARAGNPAGPVAAADPIAASAGGRAGATTGCAGGTAPPVDATGTPSALVFVASRAGIVAPSGSVPYGASKGGLHGLALTLAAALRPDGVRVHTLCPGDIDTPLMRRSLAEAAANGAGVGRIAAVLDGLERPEHVAQALVLLASTAADGLAGTVFTR